MKNNLNKMSIYQLKQLFSQLLLNELKNCRFGILVSYELSMKKRICFIKMIKKENIKININLSYIKKSNFVINCSLIPKVYYCCFFIVHLVKQLESVKQVLPKSYFEGLTYYNAIEIYNYKKTGIYSPILHRCNKNKRSYCMRPIEIYCAIKAIEKIVMMKQLELTDNDRKTLNAFKETLLQYSYLPEISYIKKRIPVYTVINSLKEIAKFIEKNPDMINEFPILTLASFNKMKKLTIRDLFLTCAESNNDFLIELAIRLVAFFHFAYTLDYKNNDYERVIEEMKKYISTYAKFHGKISMQENYFLQDNFSAVKNAVKEINCFLCMNGITVSSGNIHFII